MDSPRSHLSQISDCCLFVKKGRDRLAIIMANAAKAYQSAQRGLVRDAFKVALNDPNASLHVDDIIKAARDKSKPYYADAMKTPDATVLSNMKDLSSPAHKDTILS